ncbi:phosphate ABC transporter substrate-binding/OmpA family protein [Pseudomonas rubra]|uniref:Phosphate ABC transporter substrate-binding/OmpA family protein n=1 Tax=Pseudomonas rubra TaxID=2942627 RepID=A0ABT5P1H0_9PSED|nr:phosphate ABC transporter substrate-binding/OmpA family protein [Pseudomonas rubra]MDD1012119.1 phosphate ABC transporter substrate-binding/OmpA family protein [Pseudomonas rubra]MDD1038445.1 phosphate ABC transporter substrate-binding/OmpA family protein [Pseudomonas rubra]MDD1153482.1 phosphate ABC transporter substrate-binding/OmpA family protein [Pseudomonas rubra]
MLRHFPLLVLCLLPLLGAADPQAQLRIQGSNTIGAALAPALVTGMLEQQGASAISILRTDAANELQVRAQGSNGQALRIDIAAHGSSTGFTALKSGQAALAASSRPIKDTELSELRALGDLNSAAAEQIIALDGVAVIVHPDNPLPQLTTTELAQVFSGQISRWEQLGVANGPINLYARDDRSGTFETFKALVLDPAQHPLADNARRFESAEQLANSVLGDRQAIGFSSLATVHGTKVVAIADGESQAMLPTPALVASEDYPLSRRLYFYLPPGQANPLARALVEFAQSPLGQAIVARNGFVGQELQSVKVQPRREMPQRYLTLANDARRLSVNFRFQEGNASLDNKALRDVQRVVDYLQAKHKLVGKVVLVGFGDTKDDPQRATLLSRLRAMAVRRELARSGVELREIIGLGDELPVAANTAEEGRIRNRRVEVWTY